MAEHVKVLELDDEEYILGLANPLKIKYKDSKNILHDFEYDGNVPNNNTDIGEEPNANNSNTIDLSAGIYYAATAATASKVANPLTIHTPNGDVVYNGSVPGVEVSLTDFIGLIEVTYAELKSMRDNSELMPGAKYRIIDYDTIINGYNVANHSFDIIVEALRENLLSELCKVCTTQRDIGDRTGEAFNWGSVANWVNDNANNSDPFTGVKNNPNFYKNLSATHQNIFHQLGTRAKADNNTNAIKVTLTHASGEEVDCVGVYVTKENDSVIVGYDYHRGQCTSGLNKNNEYYVQLPRDGYTGKYSIYFCIATENETTDNVCAVKAEWYTGTTYFNNSGLSSWEIKYTLENDQSKYSWANINGKGVIYYMKDEYGNEATYDFKNVLYDGFYTFNYNIGDTNYDGSVKYGHKCFGNKLCSDLTDEVGTNKPGLPKIIFKNRYQDSVCKFNNFSSNSWNIVFGNNCSSNIFKGKAENLSFADDCILNTFGENCVGIELNNACSYNLFGNDCESIKLGQNCSYNVFGHYCKSNELKADCSYNTFGDYCTSNQINNESTNNSFGYNCTNNILASKCTENIFGAKCSNNKMGPNCQSNQFDSDCKDNILGCDDNWTFPSNISQASEGQCYANQFGYNCVNICMKNGCSYNIFGSKCGIDGFTNENSGNKFHRNCSSNNFGSNCAGNTFGEHSSYNDIGDFAVSNTFGNACQSNIFGIACQSNTFGDYMLRCKLGNKCINCKITSSEVGDTLLTHLKLIEFDNECNNVNLWVNSIDTTNYLQNYKLEGNLTGNIQITGDSPRNRSYVTNITSNSNGQIIQKCLGDTQSLITNYSNGTLTISL